MSTEQSKLLKVLAIFLMVFHHCFAFPERIPDTFLISTIIEKLATGCRLCVPIFIIISGYGFGKKIIKNYVSLNQSIKKVFEFYFLYWFTMLVTLPYGFIGGGFSLSDFSILELLGLRSSFNREWWFVGLYVLLILALPIYQRMYRLGKGKFLLITTILYAFGVILPKLFTSNLITHWIEVFLVNQYTMSIGILISDDELINRVKKHSIPLLTIPLTIATILLIRSFTIRQVYRFDPFLVGTLVIGFALIPDLFCIKITKYFPGKTITFMWLTHTFFCFYYMQDVIYGIKLLTVTFTIELVICYFFSLVLDGLYGNLEKTIKMISERT